MNPTPRPARRINLFFIVLLLFAACRHCHPHCVTQIRASGGISARALCPASPAYTESWPGGYGRGPRVRSRPAGPVETGGSGRAEAKPAGRRAEAKPAGRRATDPMPGSADARLLLGDAVDPTAAGVEFARIDSDDLPPRVHAFEHGGRLGVHRVVEGARDD